MAFSPWGWRMARSPGSRRIRAPSSRSMASTCRTDCARAAAGGIRDSDRPLFLRGHARLRGAAGYLDQRGDHPELLRAAPARPRAFRGGVAGGRTGRGALRRVSGRGVFRGVDVPSRRRMPRKWPFMRWWSGCGSGNSACSIRNGRLRTWSSSGSWRFPGANTCGGWRKRWSARLVSPDCGNHGREPGIEYFAGIAACSKDLISH